jgi:HK97 family phage major capsid protein
MSSTNTNRLKPIGLAFIRHWKAMILADNEPLHALAIAAAQPWSDTLIVEQVLKAAVSAIGTGDTGAALAAARPLAEGFLDLVRPRSLIDRILGLRQVPANVSMLKVTGAAAAAWVGQGKPKPISAMAFEREVMELTKIVCGPIVVTQELVRAAGPIAELALAHELARGVAQFGDKAFIDPSFGPVVGISPASITHGITPILSSGSSLAAVRADLKALFAGFVAADGALETAVLVMAAKTALALGLLTDGGSPVFSTIGPRGGTLCGIPVFTTAACESAGSPGETFMVLFDPAQVLIADDGDLAVRSARHASVEMSDTPTPGAVAQVSLWQNGLQALLVERGISWRRTSDTGVAVLADVTY